MHSSVWHSNYMKTKALWAVIIIMAVMLVGQTQRVNRLKLRCEETMVNAEIRSAFKYYTATEKLLRELEQMDNYHDIEWGDTICESDYWSDYQEAKETYQNNLRYE